VDPIDRFLERRPRSAKHGCTEGVRRGICQLDGVVQGGSFHDDADRGEEFFLGYAHSRSNVGEESGGEVMPLQILRVGVPLPADQALGAFGNGF